MVAKTALGFLSAMCLLAGHAFGQVVIVQRPVPAGAAETVFFDAPGVGAVMPGTVYVQRPVITAWPAPAPVIVRRPVTVWRPVTPTVVYGPAPTVVAYPALGPRVIVRPKVYVRGQPIRNVFRAITP